LLFLDAESHYYGWQVMFATFSPGWNTDVHEGSSLLGRLPPCSRTPKKKNQRFSSAAAHYDAVLVAIAGISRFLFFMAHTHTSSIR